MSDGGFFKVVIYGAIGAIGLGIFCSANCGDRPDPKLQRSVEAQGFTDVRIGDWNAFECGSGDTYSRSFTATSPTKQRVSGTVCCGYFFKGCTIRW